MDWDNDGDVDLILGPPDGRYFEHLADGSLFEWPLEQSPVKRVIDLPERPYPTYSDSMWRFVDCDEDGDFDLIRVRQHVGSRGSWWQACEHDSMHRLLCRDDFRCLGTNLSHEKNSMSWDLGSTSDGRLKIFALGGDYYSQHVELWSAGFCVPADPCHKKGTCLRRQQHCSCIAGHELSDCSGCEPHFHSVPPEFFGASQESRETMPMHSCKACPGGDGKVCYGRGSCFDDVTAKTFPQESTAALMIKGNGSCVCNEAHFFGSDEEGRSTCVDGNCPAGTEEDDGNCVPCAAGSFSLAGGVCQACLPGTFSRMRSSNCSVCPSGTVSKASGSSTCDECPPGRYEVDHALCLECPSGTVSGPASQTCSQCDAGRVSKGFVACEPCSGGTFATAGSSGCQRCPAGTFSLTASSNCTLCPRGAISKVSGSLACELCPAGRYEVKRQLCSECPGGYTSLTGNDSCSKCKAGFQSPKPGSITCEPCAAGTFAGEASSKCSACPLGTISGAASGSCSPCDAGRFSKGSLTCEPCPGGTFATAGSITCQGCPLGHVSSPSSAVCRSCDSFLIRSTPDAAKQTCQILTMDIVFALVCSITSACFVFLCWTGFYGRIPISDVSPQGPKIVLTTWTAHFLLKRACPVVTFTGTGVPDLEASSRTWRVRTLSLYQVTLHGDQSAMPLDTSTGHVRVKFPHVFFSTGFWHCPLIWWCLLLMATSAGAASRIPWSLAMVVCALGFCTGSLWFVLRRRWGPKRSKSIFFSVSERPSQHKPNTTTAPKANKKEHGTR